MTISNHFSVYMRDEKTVLELLQGLADLVNLNTDGLLTKTDFLGDHGGTWQGHEMVQTDVGIQSVVQDLQKWIKDIYVNVKDFGAKGDGVTDDRLQFQNALNSLVDGQTLVIPNTPNFYKIINATGNGATVVLQRADALANGTLKALTCSANNITVMVQGNVKATSILDDLIRFSGKNVKIIGNGGNLIGMGGVDNVGFLDTNSTDTTQQWNPKLIKLNGDNSVVETLRVIDPPTTGIYFDSTNGKCINCVVEGGKVVHGSGTWSFGVELSANSKNCTVKGLLSLPNASGGMVYDPIYNIGDSNIICENMLLYQLEHAIYNYGSNCFMCKNTIDGVNLSASAIQSFAENCTIDYNKIRNATNGGITVQQGKNTTVNNNLITECGLSGISLRTYYASAVGYSADNFSVNDNIIIFKKSISRQSGIDIQPLYGGKNLSIQNNKVSGSYGMSSPSIIAGLMIKPTAGYDFKNAMIKNNTFFDCDGYGGYINGLTESTIKDNNFIDNSAEVGTAMTIGARIYSCVNCLFQNNLFKDSRGTKVNTYAIYEDTGNATNRFHFNVCRGMLQATPIFINGTSTSTEFMTVKV